LGMPHHRFVVRRCGNAGADSPRQSAAGTKAIITAADIADGFSPDADIKPEDKETAKLIRLVVLNQGYSCNQVHGLVTWRGHQYTLFCEQYRYTVKDEGGAYWKVTVD
jgi:hypothetical protein